MAVDGDSLTVVAVVHAAIGVDADRAGGHIRQIAVFVLVARGLCFRAGRNDLLLRAQIDILVRIAEDVAVEMRQSRVALDQILQLAVGDLFAELLSGQTVEIVEPVAVH